MYSEYKKCLNNKNGKCTWLKNTVCEGSMCDVKINNISKDCPNRFNTTMGINCNIYYKQPLNWDRDRCINHMNCEYKINFCNKINKTS